MWLIHSTIASRNSTPTGGITKWGTRGNGDGQFNYPNGVAVDSAGNVYVADTFNNRIQKFDSNGGITKWGTYGTGDGEFWYPTGVAAVDSAGKVYVADEGNSRIQVFWQLVEVEKAPDGVWYLYCPIKDADGNEVPDTTTKLMPVPNGWVLGLIDDHVNKEVIAKVIGTADECIFWEVENPGNGVKGWMAYKKVSGEQYLFEGNDTEKVKVLGSKEVRANEILKAVDHYYNMNDTHSDDKGTTNLYNSNDWGYNDNNPPTFRDINNISALESNNFPIEFILAIAAQESGCFDFDNEVYGEDNIGDFLNGGVGIMQISSPSNRGLGSNLKCYSDSCKLADSSQKYPYPCGKRYHHRYYTNTSQGIYANIKDGLTILRGNYKLSKETDDIASWLITIWRNNPNLAGYLDMVIDKFFHLESDLYFGPNYTTMLKPDQILNNTYRNDLPNKIAYYRTGYACSPVEIRVRDSQGRITGLVNGEVHNEIPDSDYYNEAFLILQPDGSCSYDVVGTKGGVYGLVLRVFQLVNE